MIVINGIGGGGSSFVWQSLDKLHYRKILGRFDLFKVKSWLHKRPNFLPVFYSLMRLIKQYPPDYIVLIRPDSFWTDWKFHPSGVYNPRSSSFYEDLLGQRNYIITTRHYRSAGLQVNQNNLHIETLPRLVKSYLKQLKDIEEKIGSKIILISGHWGEYGIYKEINQEAIYLIRDPYNSLISHSKGNRHKNDYVRRGLDHINTKEWIDNYLFGPHHYWVQHARTALEHPGAQIIRYHCFKEDWKKIPYLPDISSDFIYSENDVKKILTKESIEYIYSNTRDLCQEIGIVDVHKELLE
jgi:hypothetical protein